MFESFIASFAESIPCLTRAIIALFMIVDPFGNIPIFIGLTEGLSQHQRRKVFRSATLTGFVLLLVFALTGQGILSFFHVSIYSFMIAGGILLLIIAVKLLVEGEWRRPAGSSQDVGSVPIAVPLLVGPGAITATILNFQEFGLVITVISVVIVFLFVWVILGLADQIHRFLGKSGSSIIAKIMALLIAAIAVQYMLNGVNLYFALPPYSPDR